MADESDVCGPALPPHLLKKRYDETQHVVEEASVAGPVLPPSMRAREPSPPPTASIPQAPDGEGSDSSDDDDFGPMPLPDSINAAQFDSTLADFEARSNAQRKPSSTLANLKTLLVNPG